MPREQYAARLAARTATLNELTARENRLANGRLAMFAVAMAVAWLAIVNLLFSPVWILLPLALFVLLVVRHHRVIEARVRAERAVKWYDGGLARLDGRWAGRGNLGDRFVDPRHPYAVDLDLFGKGSLFELLCTARTIAGEEFLAGWLLDPAPVEEARRRQEAVAELRPRVDLKEKLAVRGESLRAGFDPDRLRRWGEAPADPAVSKLRVMAFACPCLLLFTLVLAAFGVVPGIVVLVAILVQLGFAASMRRRVRHIAEEALAAAHDLHLFSELLAVVETEHVTSGKLVELGNALQTEGRPPSALVAQLQRLLDLLEAPKNQMFLLLLPVFLWTTQAALAIEAWRGRYAARVAGWASVLGEFEALAALSTYAWERESDVFPEFVAGGPRFQGAGLGHPLLHRATCVRNDVTLDATAPFWLVSGSNMSGKSTLLRTVGVNTVLAFAGAPVCAERLKVSPLRVGASIRTLDSIQEGKSRFFSEIIRIRDIVKLTEEERPVLFLLDEIFHGTNSHDRRIGAEAVVKGLVAAGAVGLVTTHDLALAGMNDGKNVHFQDELVEGAFRFDYTLHPGVVTKSNALELMRTVGLDV